ncbi:MAG: hypothetical protein ACFFC7_24510 [Candidatus Hermodarchaeota archaeon]
MQSIYIKRVMEFVINNFSKVTYDRYLLVMTDYSLAIAQQVGANPVICMTASLLHKLADNASGPFRANRINPVLRRCGYEAASINKIMDCVTNLLPENQSQRKSLEERVVADAYLLTYWFEMTGLYNIKFEFDVSEKIFHTIKIETETFTEDINL